ncbi:MAG: phosphoadenosine phosphosulfate reductase family protein [Halobacteria archaeon]
MTEHIALFSGGNDSLVSTHYCMTEEETDKVLYIDTGTGLKENEDFIRKVCDEYDWDLMVKGSSTSLKEFALKYGFPGPAAHSWVYRYLKERVLQQIATNAEKKPHFYGGVRRAESERRMRTVGEEEVEEGGGGRWWWHSPIMDWSDSDVEKYRDEHDLPTNSVTEKIHRSGDCFCGAFATRDEELVELQAHYPEHYEWLMSVEEEVQEELGDEEDKCYWGHGGSSDTEMTYLRKGEEKLCSSCQNNIQNSADW